MRTRIVEMARLYLGTVKGSINHTNIVDTYNSYRPRPRGYKLRYTSSWCAAFVSAMAIKCGCTDIIPVECSCGAMIELLKALGEWVEDDAFIPAAGDLIFYDWSDNGKGDNKTGHNHVGIVEGVEDGVIYVIEGNYSNAVKRRAVPVNGRYIRGFGHIRYSDNHQKTVEELAQEVINGKWGNGQDRKKRLTLAGYDCNAVQKKVNEILHKGIAK